MAFGLYKSVIAIDTKLAYKTFEFCLRSYTMGRVMAYIRCNKTI